MSLMASPETLLFNALYAPHLLAPSAHTDLHAHPVASSKSIRAALQPVRITDCPICLDTCCHDGCNVGSSSNNNTVGANGLQMPCGHAFHRRCIVRWLKRSNACPVCRYEIDTACDECNDGVRDRMRRRQTTREFADDPTEPDVACNSDEQRSAFKPDSTAAMAASGSRMSFMSHTATARPVCRACAIL
ncbi:hypothetical protein BC831DRAFT_476020 [Entophlyctis helioformis]|nr:hypothetical protein BC831DRAFT_476020 [Entophlyctis helioformis]